MDECGSGWHSLVTAQNIQSLLFPPFDPSLCEYFWETPLRTQFIETNRLNSENIKIPIGIPGNNHERTKFNNSPKVRPNGL